MPIGMALARAPEMLRRALALAALLLSAALTPVPARALELDDLHVDVRLIERNSRDPFRIRARLVGVDPKELVQGFVRLRFGDIRAEIPAGAFHRRGGSYSWRNYLFGVKKVTVNVKKATITVVGRDVELGGLAETVTLAVATSKGNVCGRIALGAPRGRGGTRKRSAAGPLESCVPPPGVDRVPPDVLVTTPTSLEGATTAVAAVRWRRPPTGPSTCRSRRGTTSSRSPPRTRRATRRAMRSPSRSTRTASCSWVHRSPTRTRSSPARR